MLQLEFWKLVPFTAERWKDASYGGLSCCRHKIDIAETQQSHRSSSSSAQAEEKSKLEVAKIYDDRIIMYKLILMTHLATTSRDARALSVFGLITLGRYEHCTADELEHCIEDQSSPGRLPATIRRTLSAACTGINTVYSYLITTSRQKSII